MKWTEEKRKLEDAIAQITEIASQFGLDFFPMRYEVCPSDTIYTFGAYGMPTRFSHWSFGKSFHRMKLQYDHGLSKIYELVINSDPCYAFLLDGNSLIQNKLIVAHVLAHSDFFKNNVRFSATNRGMVESMSAAADRIRSYEQQFGIATVEAFLDAALALQEHIDPSLRQQPEEPGYTSGQPRDRHARRDRQGRHNRRDRRDSRGMRDAARHGEYDDLWQLDEAGIGDEEEASERKALPERPEKDILQFIAAHAKGLEPWQQDIIGIVREEMRYFWPQLETKIMNEGWASYWHLRIMRELELTSEETIEFARLNASVLQPSRYSLNPYHLGLKLFEDIERRWGRAKLFEVREFDMDTSFIRNYMTKELVDDLDLYVFEKKGPEWKVTGKQWEHVRDQLISSRTNGGFPYLLVTDGDYEDSGELYMLHAYEQTELDLKYIEKTLPYVYTLWGRPVHLETIVEDKKVLFSYNGHKQVRKFL